MAWRVAVASIDGVLINEHFGRSRWFYIFDVQPDGTGIPVERRSVTPLCQSGGHTEPGMISCIDALKDCVAVLAAKIGTSARKRLELEGISVFEEPAEIEEAVRKLSAYYVRTNRPGITPES
ncbi:MAG: dinitrogenase iron-molybdenum cofactor biosynthesis protein [Spirochaetaceae bacterium]|jgi:predicted Fe-Mo cluster-binding NifX family protein|nr:dinitrogenase iron-molybdenum cofactor biosynthesis protein [Spirochaetaceae bacterium]